MKNSRPISTTLSRHPESFLTTEWLFLRLLGAVYLFAFVSFGMQVYGLIGAGGILPAVKYLQVVHSTLGLSSYWTVPTLFWLGSANGVLLGVCFAGAIGAIGLMFGFFPRICCAVLYVLYLSLCSVGQDFLPFQWDLLLLESGFLAIFLGGSQIVIWLLRILLFRLMFFSGYVKLASHDATWRSLDALRYHYWTQPLPNPVSWYMSQLPDWFQRFSTASVFSIELLVPFLIFGPQRLRLFAFIPLAGLQLLIFLTGNYTFFNILTIGLCLFLLDDRVFRGLSPPRLGSFRPTPRFVAIALACVLGPVIVLEAMQSLTGSAGVDRAIVRQAGAFGIVNSYGLFATMTTTRPEIIIQGSDDAANWQDYNFKFKPGDVRRAPPIVEPLQPRLDWQMWFAALSDWRGNPWFVNLMVRLLQGSPDVLRLLNAGSFRDKPPRYVRAIVYHYHFTSFEEKRKTGAWWRRELLGEYFPTISLRDLRNKPD